MTRTTRNMPRGFTLAEFLVSIAIFSVILTGLYTVFIWSNQTYVSGSRRQDVQQSARLAMDQMVRQIRMAGYYPENFDVNAANDIPLPPLNNPYGVPRIHVATARSLAVFGDFDGTASQVLLFCCATSAPGVQCSAANPGSILAKFGPPGIAASYTCSGNDVLADHVTNLTFTYFGFDNARNLVQIAAPLDGIAYTGPPGVFNPGAGVSNLDKAAAALSFPVGVSAAADNRQGVRVIRIQLTATESGAGRQNQAYTLNATVELRNNTDN
jgi:prepilin-type N-terminal cleavage/methylation domain-containing protein